MNERKLLVYWWPPGETHIEIRGIKPDGKFHGEILDRVRRRIDFAEGQLSAEDWCRCAELASRIAAAPRIPSDAPEQGVLCAWTDSMMRPEFDFRYHHGDEVESEAARLFLELSSLVRREAVKGHPEFTQQSAAGYGSQARRT